MDDISLFRTRTATVWWYLRAPWVRVAVALTLVGGLAGGVVWKWDAVSAWWNTLPSVVFPSASPSPSHTPTPGPSVSPSPSVDLGSWQQANAALSAAIGEAFALMPSLTDEAATVLSAAISVAQQAQSEATTTGELVAATARLLEAVETARETGLAPTPSPTPTPTPTPTPKPTPTPTPTPKPPVVPPTTPPKPPQPPTPQPVSISRTIQCAAPSSVTVTVAGSGSLTLNVSGAASASKSGSGEISVTVTGGPGSFVAKGTATGGQVQIWWSSNTPCTD